MNSNKLDKLRVDLYRLIDYARKSDQLCDGAKELADRCVESLMACLSADPPESPELLQLASEDDLAVTKRLALHYVFNAVDNIVGRKGILENAPMHKVKAEVRDCLQTLHNDIGHISMKRIRRERG